MSFAPEIAFLRTLDRGGWGAASNCYPFPWFLPRSTFGRYLKASLSSCIAQHISSGLQQLDISLFSRLQDSNYFLVVCLLLYSVLGNGIGPSPYIALHQPPSTTPLSFLHLKPWAVHALRGFFSLRLHRRGLSKIAECSPSMPWVCIPYVDPF